LLLVALVCACGNGGGNPAGSTLVDSCALVDAQPLSDDRLRWLVRFSQGPDSIVTVPSGKRVDLEERGFTVIEANASTALGWNNGLEKLDLSSGATTVLPLTARVDSLGQAFAVHVAGLYVYATRNTTAAAVDAAATPLELQPAPGCDLASVVEAQPLGAGALAGWYSVRGSSSIAGCPTLWVVNMALRVSVVGERAFAGTDRIFLFGGGGLTIVDAKSGSTAAVALSEPPTDFTSLGRSRVLAISAESNSLSRYRVLDLTTGNLVADFAGAQSAPFSGPDSRVAGLELTGSFGKAAVDFASGTAGLVCGGTSVKVTGPDGDVGFWCGEGGSLKVFDGLIGPARVVSTLASEGVTLGPLVVWNEGTSLRAVRVGKGEGPLALCANGSNLVLQLKHMTRDGRRLVFQCGSTAASGSLLAADFHGGFVTELLPPPDGVSLNVFDLAVTPGGRGLVGAVASGRPLPGQPDCLSSSCTFAYDFVSGTGSTTRSGSFVNQLFSGLIANDDETVVAPASLSGTTTPVVLFAGALPSPVDVPARLDAVYGITPGLGVQQLLAHVSDRPQLVESVDLFDLIRGTRTTFPSAGAPHRIPGTNLFWVRGLSTSLETADGLLVDLIDGSTRSLAGTTPLCRFTNSAGIEATGALTYLDAASTLHAISSLGEALLPQTRVLLSGDCGIPVLLLTRFDGTTGGLIRYDPATHLFTNVAEKAADVTAQVPGSTRALAFANADSTTGDAVLIGADGSTALLGARVAFSAQSALSPHDKRLALEGRTAAGAQQVLVVNTDGSISHELGVWGWPVRYSPDESRAFVKTAENDLWAETAAGKAARVDARVSIWFSSTDGRVVLYSTSAGTFAKSLP
jgi:hypothetical protein